AGDGDGCQRDPADARWGGHWTGGDPEPLHAQPGGDGSSGRPGPSGAAAGGVLPGTDTADRLDAGGRQPFGTSTAWAHWGHLIFLPASAAFAFRLLPQAEQRKGMCETTLAGSSLGRK